MKIAHFADTHIFNLKHHEELAVVLEQIDRSLAEEKPDIIVHAGDVIDSKVTVTGELLDMVIMFFDMLSRHAKVFIVPGNHDGLIHNQKRVIVLQPIVKAMKNKNLVLYKGTGTFVYKNFAFHSLSIFEDQSLWESLKIDDDMVNIGVYHGTVGCVRTDSNFQMEGEVDLSCFSKFDYLMLGHIHYAQAVDKAGKARYAGSTMQCSYDETPQKGYLLWDIKSKEDFSVEPRLFVSPHPFQTIQIMSANELVDSYEHFDILNGCRLRVVVNDPNFSLQDEESLKKFLKSKITYNTVQFIKGAGAKRRDVEETIRAIELGKLEVQQSLVIEHLSSVLGVKDDKLIKDVMDLNAKLFSEEDQEEYLLKRNTSFNIKSIGWSNFFSYGPDNEIVFDDYQKNGVLGIFGENFSGKSSIIDILCFVLWNNVTKDIQKNVEVMRFGTAECSAFVIFEHGGKEYRVERGLKKSKSGNTKSDLSFCVVGEENKLEDKKKNTDKEIITFVGEMNDFMTTSFMSQFSGMMFVNEKSAARRDVLKRILNLGVFDKRIEKLNKEIYYLDRKRAEMPDGIDDEVRSLQEHLQSYDVELERKREIYKELDAQVAEYQKFDLMVKAEKENIKGDGDIELVCVNLEEIVRKYLVKRYKSITDDTCVSPRIPRWSKNLNLNSIIQDIKLRENTILEFNNNKKKLFSSIEELNSVINGYEQKNVDRNVPCLNIDGNIVSTCSLAEFFVSSRDMTQKNRKKLRELQEQYENLLLEESKIESIKKEIDILNKKRLALVAFNEKESKYNQKQTELRILKSEIDKVVSEYKIAKRKNENYYKQQALREKLSVLERKNIDNLNKFNDAKKQRDEVLKEGTVLRDKKSAMLERLKVLLEKEQKYQEELYRSTVVKTLHKVFVGNSGLTISIMKRFIPLINAQANEILSQMSNISINLEATERDTLELSFVNGDGENRSVGSSSGAERTMISLALRMALASITSLPVANLFIMDEPATAFDEKRLEEFEKVLSVVKTRFEHVILITHINTLKEYVDSIIRVEKNNNISCLVEERL